MYIPRLVNVCSPSIEAVGFHEGVLFVRFTQSILMRYENVTLDQFKAMRTSNSPARYLVLEISRTRQGFVVPT